MLIYPSQILVVAVLVSADACLLAPFTKYCQKINIAAKRVAKPQTLRHRLIHRSDRHRHRHRHRHGSRVSEDHLKLKCLARAFVALPACYSDSDADADCASGSTN